MGAFAHCLITVALNQGLSHDSHGAFGRISQRLDAVHGGNEWRSRFGSAERLHFHFYHGNLPTEEVRSHRRAPSEYLSETVSRHIHPTTHKHDFEPMDGGGRYILQPPQCEAVNPPRWSTLPPPFTP